MARWARSRREGDEPGVYFVGEGGMGLRRRGRWEAILEGFFTKGREGRMLTIFVLLVSFDSPGLDF